MSNLGPAELALIALTLPLLAAVAAAVMGVTKARDAAHLPVVAAFAVAACLAAGVLVLVATAPGETVAFSSATLTWFKAGGVAANYSIAVDPISAVMLLTVTFVATWIAIFSAGYMHHDPGYARYFAVMSLFVFAMCLLVLADNFFLLLAGWEGVGLCSYLLVGYYYAKPSAAAAARKAFLVTRLGDVGLVLGVFLLWSIGGYSTDFATVFEYVSTHPETHGQLNVACLLLFCGAVGKSAQLPLFVWLPDAMEGPTPVSALIHAATMVAAGVYLLARCAPLFPPDCLLVIQGVGAFTMIFAAVVAVTQTDIKRVLAYSTMSQLGMMVFAVGIGAWTAGVFHLVTHAAFKALLFLGAGSVIHALHHEQDLRAMGGLRRRLPLTAVTVLVGVLAISGVPLLSGWASKELILGESLAFVQSDKPLARLGVLPFVGAVLTAYYMLRLWLLTFAGQPRSDAAGHAHESPPSMAVPLLALAGLTVVAGLGLPVWEAEHSVLATFLDAARPVVAPAAHDHHALTLALGAGCFLVGFAAALTRHAVGHLIPAHAPRGSNFDRLYRTLFSGPTLALGRLVAARDKGQRLSLDAAMSLPAVAAPRLADRLRRTQTGNVRHYVLALAVCLLCALSALTLLR